MRAARKAFQVSVLMLGICVPASALQKGKAAEKADACALPAPLLQAVQERFGSTRVLKTSDLYEDERKLFVEDHKAACPGLATGRYFGAQTRPATAIILLDVGAKKDVRLIVARPAGAHWVLVEVETLEAGSTAVVWTEGPATYSGAFAERTIVSKNDVIALTGYESWQRVYAWNGKTFDVVQTSD